MARPLESSRYGDYVTMKPKPSDGGQGGHGFHSRDVESCLPKGFRHSSAPSRYVNYHTLGSTTMCSSNDHVAKP